VINHIVAKHVAKDADCRGFPCVNRFALYKKRAQEMRTCKKERQLIYRKLISITRKSECGRLCFPRMTYSSSERKDKRKVIPEQ